MAWMITRDLLNEQGISDDSAVGTAGPAGITDLAVMKMERGESESLMQTPDGAPLLLLNRVGQGRVASVTRFTLKARRSLRCVKPPVRPSRRPRPGPCRPCRPAWP